MKLRHLLRPWVLIVVPVIASFIAWSIPGSGIETRGFEVRSAVTPGSVLILVMWYATAAALATLGTLIGRSIAPNADWNQVQLSRGFERRFYFIISVCSVIGVAGAYILIARSESISAALSADSVNNLSAVLLGGSSIATLRYAAIVAAPVGVILAREGKAGWISAFVNVILLLAVALLSSRLSLIMAVAVYLIVYVMRNPDSRIKKSALLVGMTSMFALLTVFNYFRNANYYEAIGITNPVVMNFSQIETYLGAPAQVSVGVAGALLNGRLIVGGGIASGLQAILPTFLRSSASTGAPVTGSAAYGYTVDVASNLTTNSAFADLYAHTGWFGLGLALSVLCVMSVIFGYFLRRGSILSSIAAVIGYCYLEMWRIYLLNQGIVLFLVLILLVATVLARAAAVRELHAVRVTSRVRIASSPRRRAR